MATALRKLRLGQVTVRLVSIRLVYTLLVSSRSVYVTPPLRLGLLQFGYQGNPLVLVSSR